MVRGNPKRFIGKPCVNGHGGERYTNGGECCQCAVERNRYRRAGGKPRVVQPLRVSTKGRALKAPFKSTEQHSGLVSSASRVDRMRIYPLTDFTGRIYEIPIVCRLIWWGLR